MEHTLPKVFIGRDIQSRFISACENGDISTVNKMLRLHLSGNTKDVWGNAALAMACKGKGERLFIVKKVHIFLCVPVAVCIYNFFPQTLLKSSVLVRRTILLLACDSSCQQTPYNV